MVVNNPNNWHWVDKNCLSWARDYFTEKLTGLSVSGDDKNVKITSVSSVEGDCEVNQRKGKVISLFDLKIILKFDGAVREEDVSGSITIPELAYDTEAEDIQFDISVYNDTLQKDEIRPVIKSQIIPQIRTILSSFGKDLIAVHSKDIQLDADKVQSVLTKENQKGSAVTKDNNVSSQSTKVVPKPATTQSAPSTKSSGSVPKYNTSTLHLEPTFNTTAEQLYITLLDPQRIAAWSRSPPLIEPLPSKVGSTFKIFGGSITGKITRLVDNEHIVQDWRLEDWKLGHFAKLDITLNQGNSETKMVVKFSGIPIGEEDRVRNNFEDYYIRSIKVTFGFGAVL